MFQKVQGQIHIFTVAAMTTQSSLFSVDIKLTPPGTSKLAVKLPSRSLFEHNEGELSSVTVYRHLDTVQTPSKLLFLYSSVSRNSQLFPNAIGNLLGTILTLLLKLEVQVMVPKRSKNSDMGCLISPRHESSFWDFSGILLARSPGMPMVPVRNQSSDVFCF